MTINYFVFDGVAVAVAVPVVAPGVVVLFPGETVAVPTDGVARPGDTVAEPGDWVASPGVVPDVAPGVDIGAVTVDVAAPGSFFLAQAPILKTSAISRNTVNNFFIF